MFHLLRNDRRLFSERQSSSLLSRVFRKPALAPPTAVGQCFPEWFGVNLGQLRFQNLLLTGLPSLTETAEGYLEHL